MWVLDTEWWWQLSVRSGRCTSGSTIRDRQLLRVGFKSLSRCPGSSGAQGLEGPRIFSRFDVVRAGCSMHSSGMRRHATHLDEHSNIAFHDVGWQRSSLPPDAAGAFDSQVRFTESCWLLVALPDGRISREFTSPDGNVWGQADADERSLEPKPISPWTTARSSRESQTARRAAGRTFDLFVVTRSDSESRRHLARRGGPVNRHAPVLALSLFARAGGLR